MKDFFHWTIKKKNPNCIKSKKIYFSLFSLCPSLMGFILFFILFYIKRQRLSAALIRHGVMFKMSIKSLPKTGPHNLLLRAFFSVAGRQVCHKSTSSIFMHKTMPIFTKTGIVLISSPVPIPSSSCLTYSWHTGTVSVM